MADNSKSDTFFAVVSPCSHCKNQRAEMDINGKPFCPRRKWQADEAGYELSNNGNTNPRLLPLAAYGTEGTSQEGDKSLRNPVYLDDGKTTLVWVASLRENSGVYDGKNNLIGPQILDPSFNTDYIECRLFPYIPAQHEAAYRQSGALKENDTLIAIQTDQQLMNQTSVIDAEPNIYESMILGGVVSKVNLLTRTPRADVDVDHVVQGS